MQKTRYLGVRIYHCKSRYIGRGVIASPGEPGRSNLKTYEECKNVLDTDFADKDKKADRILKEKQSGTIKKHQHL